MIGLQGVALGLVLQGRGLLALDHPRTDVQEILGRARIAVTAQNCAALRDLVLSTPGLDRVLGGLVVDPGALCPALLTARRPVGVCMGDENPGDLAELIARYGAAGATFARMRVEFPQDGPDASGRARPVARWAATCQRGGLVPFVDCRVAVGAHHGFAEAEEAHTAAITAVVTELGRAGADPAATLLGTRPVVPGHRSSQVDASADVARATVRSLREAGADDVAGVVFTPPHRARQLTAHLAAVQWAAPGWPIGFCLGRSVLAPVAAAWRGRPERVAAAQYELYSRLHNISAVLRAERGDVTYRTVSSR